MKGKRGNQSRDDNLAQKYKTNGLCTTVMIRNIPNEYTQDELIDEVSQSMGSPDIFDFFYLPWDSQNNSNVGYAFVNFHHSSMAQKAVRVFSSYKFKHHQSTKVAQVSPAHIQGLENNLRHLQDRAVVHSNLPYSPVVLWKGMKIELSAIFHELRVQDMLKKFTVPQAVPGASTQRYMQGGDQMFQPPAGNFMDPASADGIRAPYMGQQPLESSFADLLDRAAEGTGGMTFTEDQSLARFSSEARALQGAVPGMEPMSYNVPPGSAGSKAAGACGACPGQRAGGSPSSMSQRADAGLGFHGNQRQNLTGNGNHGYFPAADDTTMGDAMNMGLGGCGSVCNMEFNMAFGKGGAANMAFGKGGGCPNGGCSGGGSSKGMGRGTHGAGKNAPNPYTGLDMQRIPNRDATQSRTMDLWEDDGPSNQPPYWQQQQPQAWQQQQQPLAWQQQQQQPQPWGQPPGMPHEAARKIVPPESAPAMSQTLENRFGIPKLPVQALSSSGTRADGNRKKAALAAEPQSTSSSETDVSSGGIASLQYPIKAEMQQKLNRSAPGLVLQERQGAGGGFPNTAPAGCSSMSAVGWSSNAAESPSQPPAHELGPVTATQGQGGAFTNWSAAGNDAKANSSMQLPGGGGLDASQQQSLPQTQAQRSEHAAGAHGKGLDALSPGNAAGDDNEGIRDIIVQNAQDDVLQKFLSKFGP